MRRYTCCVHVPETGSCLLGCRRWNQGKHYSLIHDGETLRLVENRNVYKDAAHLATALAQGGHRGANAPPIGIKKLTKAHKRFPTQSPAK